MKFAEKMAASQEKNNARMEALAQRKWENDHRKWVLVPAVCCGVCNETGSVRASTTEIKSGTSRGKVAAGILTGGASLLATGLAAKIETVTYSCGSCRQDYLGQRAS